MPRRRASRILLVGGDRFLWSVGHLHERVDTPGVPPVYRDCREIVRVRRHKARGLLEVVFRAGDGRIIPDGVLESGAVMWGDGRALNLHEPGTARALLDEALANGWRPDDPSPVELDGWTLFDPVFARRCRP
ncbi:hypothetical protein GCM10010168_18420 [Actinoplanes ianthinogenes]|uniref:Uncharacterized protein n=1 Tax=Actinoplanes ianthinogenes TaxID=122358 RepID=A0ABN6CV61_9ACTN|nr:hypothetical protein [Actinoplanes ianthinogenes]BCJ47484.1 hypothetical protein Aiant_81410 [Actinoplanes ianthinogenes]GGR02085.1 hypothetical protein GCM10010168_18420 [Actinoplanes ianthinogenes]